MFLVTDDDRDTTHFASTSGDVEELSSEPWSICAAKNGGLSVYLAARADLQTESAFGSLEMKESCLKLKDRFEPVRLKARAE
jgi:hypothetical protein